MESLQHGTDPGRGRFCGSFSPRCSSWQRQRSGGDATPLRGLGSEPELGLLGEQADAQARAVGSDDGGRRGAGEGHSGRVALAGAGTSPGDAPQRCGSCLPPAQAMA